MDIIEKLRQERAEAKRIKEDEHQKALDYDPFANKGMYNGIGLTQELGSMSQDNGYEPNLIHSEIPKKTEAKEVFEVGALAKMEATPTEGKFGMNYLRKGAFLHKTARDVAESWGVSTRGVPEDKIDSLANSFLIAMRKRFMERYETMLSCVSSLKMYAEFKGVPYGRIANKVYGGKGKALEVVEIGGSKFILITTEEFMDWHRFLAEKGAKEMADHGEHGRAVYYAQMYHATGGDEGKALGFLKYNSVDDFLSVYEGGIKPEGGRGIPGRRGNFFDALRGTATMADFYATYNRWCRDVMKIKPIEKRAFNKMIYGKGYRKFTKDGARGVYIYRIDEKPVGTIDGRLRIPKRGRYHWSKNKGDLDIQVDDAPSWSKFENLGGEVTE